MKTLRSGRLSVHVSSDGLVSLAVERWDGFRCEAARVAVSHTGGAARLRGNVKQRSARDGVEITDEFEPGLVLCRRVVQADDEDALTFYSELTLAAGQAVHLLGVSLLDCTSGISLGRDPASVRIYEQGAYWARVRRLGTPAGSTDQRAEMDASQTPTRSSSQYVWVAYDAAADMALLAGFETGERWTGHITAEGQAGAMPSRWTAGFHGGRTLIQPGERVPLEVLTVMVGEDPWELLCRYGDRVKARHNVRVPGRPPVSWCSWYPYRLGVTEDRALATAEIARERLKPLGLDILVLDLGWQKGYLPCSFQENDQFPSGLKALSEKLRRLGFRLGAWCGPFTISAHDPLVSEHPEWLLSANDGPDGERRPEPTGTWFWQPHGETFALDLTHPDAVAWLRRNIQSLAERGVRYLKPDFIGGVAAEHLTGRNNPAVVAGGGAEASRIGLETMRNAMTQGHPDALLLNCGGPEIPGRGALPLLYTCNDTGNTGYVGWRHLEEDYGCNVAGHLWKNRRWGIIQPSCMVVGLPGDVEEGRLRATATFLAGGQVDLGDDLLTLPEDRWHIIQASLPPLGISARPVDLFEPIATSSLAYDAQTSGRGGDTTATVADGISRVWVLPMRTDWDEWILIGLFNYDMNDNVPYGKAQISRFQLPLHRVGLTAGRSYAAYEFWSGQFLGVSPFVRDNPHGYRHPGDTQSLIRSERDDLWEVSFFGPGVKLLVVRAARGHPWPAGTTFHQSGGTELSRVRWNGETLSGELRRPAGESGLVAIAAGKWKVVSARVNRRPVPVRFGANGSVLLPVLCEHPATPWEVRFRPAS